MCATVTIWPRSGTSPLSRTPRAAEYAGCFDPIIAAPGLYAMTDHDRLVCDSCAHDLGVFEFLRLRSARFDGMRAAAR